MNIYEAITGIMQESYAISKEKRNQQQGFLYRGIDDVMNAFHPLLSKYKVFCVPEVISREREERTTNRGGTLIYSILTIRYTFYAEDGTSISAVVVGEGMDSADKASNKAMAVGMKYAMFQVFCIPTEDMTDPDAEVPPPSKPSSTPPQSAGPTAEEARQFEQIMIRVQEIVEGIIDIESANAAAAEIPKLGHVLDSKRHAAKMLKQKTDALGYIWNKDGGYYINYGKE